MSTFILLCVLNVGMAMQTDTTTYDNKGEEMTLGDQLTGFSPKSTNATLFMDTMSIAVSNNNLLPYYRYPYNGGMYAYDYNTHTVKEEVQVSINMHFLTFFFLKDVSQGAVVQETPTPYQIDMETVKAISIDEGEVDIKIGVKHRKETLTFYFEKPETIASLYAALRNMQPKLKFDLEVSKKLMSLLNLP